MTVYRQADDRWSQAVLGEGPSTIGRSGCLLVCLAMAREHILGCELAPLEANERCLAAGAYHRSLLIVPRAAEALGLALVERLGGPGQPAPSLEAMRALVDEALSAGGVAVLHVDHDARGGGDHFVLIYDRAGAGYLAADPAPGTSITLDADLRGRSRWGTVTRAYAPAGAMFIGKGER